MGRPNALDYNIAKRIIGKEYKLMFVYVGQNMTDSLGIKYYEDLNKVSREKKAKKYGDNWTSIFNDKVNAELTIQHSLRTIIKNSNEYKNVSVNELYILFDRRKCSTRKYCAYVVGRVLKNDQYRIKVFLRIKVNSKNREIKKVTEKEFPLPYAFEENGIF